MPLNEDELLLEFVRLANGLVLSTKHRHDDETGEVIFGSSDAHTAFLLFKAAYSPEVLQALGVAMVPTEPTDDMVIAFAEEWFCQKQAIDDVKMDEAYQAMLASSPYAIKENS